VGQVAVFPVIMCGGSGTRLWPASQPAWPKQFIALVGERSSFQDTVLRVAGLAEARAPLIVAGVSHRAAIQAQLAELGIEAVLLLEPEARDSAAAMAAAAAWIEREDPEGVAVVVSADHHIPDGAAFRRFMDQAVGGARTGAIVTLGVRPAGASTAYGYIRAGEGQDDIRPVAAFVEKPDAATAQAYVEAGYLWNSGNFVVSAKTLADELTAHAPAVLAAARAAVAEGVAIDGVTVLGAAFRGAPKISIDYAVMEKTARAAVLPVDFAWSDLGAWDAVAAATPVDEAGNGGSASALFVNAANSFVRAPEGVQVAVIGARDIAVVVEGSSVLVCDLSHSQSVKTAVDQLKALGRDGAKATGGFKTLAEASAWYDRWLRTSALPLWWSLGADHEHGGFREGLTPQGEPWLAPRRARVQARQAYVYVAAGAIGWTGPWRQAAWHGLDGFLADFRREDGLFRTLVDTDGAPLDETALLYDQAFALLAMAELHRTEPGRIDLVAEAKALRASLQAIRHPAGGFRESVGQHFQSNAHMHLLEAALAWSEAGEASWDGLADEIVGMALTRFIDPEHGFLREFFDATWAPKPGNDGRIVEPGHQFEWAWLLERWGVSRGRGDARAAARKLFAHGIKGIDPVRGVAVNQLWDDLSVKDAGARLWPQTEYLKAALILGEESHAVAAANALKLYLDTPALGVWRDKLGADGRFVEEPAPASSFYHITCACLALFGASPPQG
jgi:mannose-1-phosphate guanylyltransferase/mannose-6-phosphate isomerase